MMTELLQDVEDIDLYFDGYQLSIVERDRVLDSPR